MAPSDDSVRSIFDRDSCVFCGSRDMTKEHLIAEWVLRAVQRNRRPRATFVQRLPDGSFRDRYGEQQLAATVLCRACNNDWVSNLDRAASSALKPLVRNAREVELDNKGQALVSAWAFKTVLVNDLAITHGASALMQCAAGFRATGFAPSCIEVWAGLSGPHSWVHPL